MICVLAMQSIQQLLDVGRGNNRSFQTKVLANLRSKVVFGGVDYVDAKYFSELSGVHEVEQVSTSSGVSRGKDSWFVPSSANEGEKRQMVEKALYDETKIMFMEAQHVWYRVMDNRSIQFPSIGLVDWFERRGTSNIGNVYWFDNAEFFKRLSERQARKAPRKGLLNMLGFEVGSEAGQKPFEVKEFEQGEVPVDDIDEKALEIAYQKMEERKKEQENEHRLDDPLSPGEIKPITIKPTQQAQPGAFDESVISQEEDEFVNSVGKKDDGFIDFDDNVFQTEKPKQNPISITPSTDLKPLENDLPEDADDLLN